MHPFVTMKKKKNKFAYYPSNFAGGYKFSVTQFIPEEGFSFAAAKARNQYVFNKEFCCLEENLFLTGVFE